MRLEPSILTPLADGLFWACVASAIWLPLSASYRNRAARRHRLFAGLTLSVLALPLGLMFQAFAPHARHTEPSHAIGWWLAGFILAGLTILGVTMGIRGLTGRSGYTSPSAEDSADELMRWRRAPPAIAVVVMLVAGGAYHLAMIAALT